MNTVDLHEAAQTYQALGWAIVPIRAGTKTPAFAWNTASGKFTPDELQHWFQERQDITGLAVINGERSDHLVCRDFDTESSYEMWSEAHPELAALLPTVQTCRGKHVYFRCPHVAKIRKLDEGELRGNGYNLLPPSKHPHGIIYRWIVPLEAEALKTIEDIESAGLIPSSHRNRTEETEYTKATETTKETKKTEQTEEDRCNEIQSASRAAPLQLSEQRQEHLIRSTLPTEAGQRHRKLFELARKIKSQDPDKVTPAKAFHPLIKEWHRRALSVIRTKDLADSLLDFYVAWEQVKIGADQSPLLLAAKAARNGPLPQVAQRFAEIPAIQQLIALCKQLQLFTGERPFYLSCRSAALHIGCTYQEANRLLRLLVFEDVLTVAAAGKPGGRQATRYQYTGD